MSNPIGLGVIGLGESGQHHISVVAGERCEPEAPTRGTRTDLAGSGKQLINRLLGRGSAQPPAPEPGVEELRVVAVSDLDESRLAWARKHYDIPHAFTDYKQLLARQDIEAVLICTPPAYHPQITIEAARHGKHVFCEKPMAMTSSRCVEMLEATEKAGVVFQVGYMLRFANDRGRIVEALRNNEIGRPVFFREIISLRAGGDQLWIHDHELGGGPLWEVSHGIDFVRRLFGDPEVVFGIGGHFKPNKTTALDTYAVSMNFASGDKALVADSYALKNFGWDNEACRNHRTEIDVVGPGGYIQFPDADLSNRLTICSYAEPEDRIEKVEWDSVWGADEQGYRKQLKHFVDCIHERKKPEASGYEGWRTVQLIETIYDSIRTGEARQFGILR